MAARFDWLRWIVIVLALVLGGWFVFDGGHALITGDYVTPDSGRFAGQLGPWSRLVSAVGIEPRSTLMKSLHVALGAGTLVATALFACRRRGATWGMLACAALSLWYLPFGTLLALTQIVLVCVLRRRV